MNFRHFWHTAWVKKKQSPVRCTVVSIYADEFLQYFTEYIEKICNTKVIDLPTSPTQCQCTTLGKLISSFQLIARWYILFGSMFWLWKEPLFWCWDENADLEVDWVTAAAQSDHQWQPRIQSSAHATSAFSSCWQWNLSHIERNVKLENNIREKELLIWSVSLMMSLIILLIRWCS